MGWQHLGRPPTQSFRGDRALISGLTPDLTNICVTLGDVFAQIECQPHVQAET